MDISSLQYVIHFPSIFISNADTPVAILSLNLSYLIDWAMVI
jgi:hypothetical protein